MFQLLIVSSTVQNTQLTIKNYDLGFNQTYYGNVSIICKNQGACNMTKIYCDTGNCYIEAAENNNGQLNNSTTNENKNKTRKNVSFAL